MAVGFGTIGRGRHIPVWVVASDVDGGAKSDLLMEVITFFAGDFRGGGGVQCDRLSAWAAAPGVGGGSWHGQRLPVWTRRGWWREQWVGGGSNGEEKFFFFFLSERGREGLIRCFSVYLIWCNILMCQLLIGGHKGHNLCHDLLKVILCKYQI
jgi:hypothetical protein